MLNFVLYSRKFIFKKIQLSICSIGSIALHTILFIMKIFIIIMASTSFGGIIGVEVIEIHLKHHYTNQLHTAN